MASQTVLKTAGGNASGGSTPSPSAKEHEIVLLFTTEDGIVMAAPYEADYPMWASPMYMGWVEVYAEAFIREKRGCER